MSENATTQRQIEEQGKGLLEQVNHLTDDSLSTQAYQEDIIRTTQATYTKIRRYCRGSKTLSNTSSLISHQRQHLGHPRIQEQMRQSLGVTKESQSGRVSDVLLFARMTALVPVIWLRRSILHKVYGPCWGRCFSDIAVYRQRTNPALIQIVHARWCLLVVSHITFRGGGSPHKW